MGSFFSHIGLSWHVSRDLHLSSYTHKMARQLEKPLHLSISLGAYFVVNIAYWYIMLIKIEKNIYEIFLNAKFLQC